MALDVFAMVQQLTAKCARCNRAAIDLCSCPCRLVFYCDVQCQQEDWPHHKANCTKARHGRLPQSYCSYCGVASVSLKSCLCEAALYCSFECQRKHYGTHGRTCSAAVPRFRKRRKKPTSTTLDGAVGAMDGDDPDKLNGADGGAAAAAEEEPDAKEIEIQTETSCEALLIRIKQSLRPTLAETVSPDPSPASLSATMMAQRAGHPSGGGLNESSAGEMAFRSKKSRASNGGGASGAAVPLSVDSDGESSSNASRRQTPSGGRTVKSSVQL